jgi:hypothetical protein
MYSTWFGSAQLHTRMHTLCATHKATQPLPIKHPQVWASTQPGAACSTVGFGVRGWLAPYPSLTQAPPLKPALRFKPCLLCLLLIAAQLVNTLGVGPRWCGLDKWAPVVAYDGGGNCSACLRTFLRYSAKFAVNDWKASDCAGLFSLGVSNSSCTTATRAARREQGTAQHSTAQHSTAQHSRIQHRLSLGSFPHRTVARHAYIHLV